MTQRFDNRTAQLAMTGFGALMGLVGVAGLSQGDLEGLGYLGFAVFIIWRGRTSSSVTVDDQDVTTRSIVRTRHVPLADLRAVDVLVGRTGLNGFGREYLLLRRADGSEIAFKELSSKPSTDGSLTVVRRAAAAITERVA